MTFDLRVEVFEETLVALTTAVHFAFRKGVLESCSVAIIDNGENAVELQRFVDKNHRTIPTSLHSTGHNIGFGRAHNLAFSAGMGSIHLILNPDAIMAEDSIYHALRYLSDHKDTVAVCPNGLDKDQNPGFLCKRYPSIAVLLLRGIASDSLNAVFSRLLNRYQYTDLPDDRESEVTLASGCCLMCRSDALETVGGFDPQFFLYFEDFDLSLRLSDIGKLVYLPTMKITHYGGDSSRKGLTHIYMFCKSAQLFFGKWGWKMY